MVIFLLAGMGNGSTYKMIPSIFARCSGARRPPTSGSTCKDAAVEFKRRAAAVIGIAGAIGAFGGVLIQVVLRQASLGVSSLVKRGHDAGGEGGGRRRPRRLVGARAVGVPRLLRRVRRRDLGRVPAAELRPRDGRRTLAAARRCEPRHDAGRSSSPATAWSATRWSRRCSSAARPTTWDIVVFGEEPRLAYDRVGLSSFFDGHDAPTSSRSSRPAPTTGSTCTSATRSSPSTATRRRSTSAARHAIVAYDELVLATGSYPFVPPIPGHDLPGCFVYRTIDDLERHPRRTPPGARVGAVIGGGLLGLEAANALRTSASRPTSSSSRRGSCRCRSTTAAARRCAPASRRSASPCTPSMQTTEIVAGDDGRVAAHALRRRRRRSTVDLVVFSAGIRPRDELARDVRARRRRARRHRRRRRVPHVRPAHLRHRRVRGRRRPHLRPGRARLRDGAGRRPTASSAATPTFTGADLSTKLKLLGVDVASFGDAFGADARRPSHHLRRPGRRRLQEARRRRRRHAACSAASWSATPSAYQVLAADGARRHADARASRAADLARRRRRRGRGRRRRARRHRDGLLVQQRHQGRDLRARSPTAALTDVGAAQGVHQGRHRLRRLRPARHRAAQGTSCARPASRSTTTCASTSPTPARSCSTSCASTASCRSPSCSPATARGRGCEICKPAVASILASTGQRLHPRRRAGRRCRTPTTTSSPTSSATAPTRSCRACPAARSRPTSSSPSAQVAKEFGLYTKITGGQRIDLFGARVEQLPAHLGAARSTPASSRATPTARRCAR